MGRGEVFDEVRGRDNASEEIFSEFSELEMESNDSDYPGSLYTTEENLWEF